jgi:5-hydroxyisourate hydrolase-like protein (transthyretin family)
MTQRLTRRLVCGAISAAVMLTMAAHAQTAGNYRIAGTVVNAQTGGPVWGATVEALNEEGSYVVASTESGEDGHFTLEHLAAAKYPLRASKRGYCAAYYDDHDGYNTAIVTGADQRTGDLVFRVTPEGLLSGVVTGDGGDPAEGATVMLFKKPRNHEAGGKIVQMNSEQTDDTGAYEFTGLTAGEYLLAVRAQPWYALSRTSASEQRRETEAEAALDVAYPVTFFDSTTDEGSATPIALSEGSREEANLSLHAVPALRMEFQGTSKQDEAISRPELRQPIFGMDAPLLGAGLQYDAQTGSGEFSGVAPGHYELTVGNPPRVMEMDAAVSGQVDTSSATATVAVSGALENASGEALAGEAVVTLTPGEGADARANAQSTTLVRGGFSFQAVPGAWQLRVMNSSGVLPVLAITAGGRRQAGNRVTVEDRALALRVTVSANPTRVEGFARQGGKGFAGALVLLIPKDLGTIAELARRDQSDSDGSFALLNVAPGQYTAVAIKDGWDLEWENPEAIARYLPGGVAVTVGGGKDSEPDKRMGVSGPVPVQTR